jgi:uncharacterized glyoxalase superfamily protein PhnB
VGLHSIGFLADTTAKATDIFYPGYAHTGRGVIIRQPPTNMPWGTRAMNVEDPDGHRFRVSGDSTGPIDEAGLKRFSEIERYGG